MDEEDDAAAGEGDEEVSEAEAATLVDEAIEEEEDGGGARTRPKTLSNTRSGVIPLDVSLPIINPLPSSEVPAPSKRTPTGPLTALLPSLAAGSPSSFDLPPRATTNNFRICVS